MPPAQYLRVIDIQARMQPKSDSSKFLFGYLWWFLEPLLGCGKFAFLLFTSGIFRDVRAVADPEKVALVLNLNPLAFLL